MSHRAAARVALKIPIVKYNTWWPGLSCSPVPSRPLQAPGLPPDSYPRCGAQLPPHLPNVRMTSMSLILVMAFFPISAAARVIRVLMNSLILSMMATFASASDKDGGDLAMTFLNAYRVWSGRFGG